MNLMTKSEVCGVLGISERTLEGYVRRRKFPPPVAIGKRVVWAHEAIQRWREQTFAAQLEFTVRSCGDVRVPSGAVPQRA